MSLFSKNKPTKRVDFTGGYVELGYLSKGVKDDLQNQLLEAVKGVDPRILEKLESDTKQKKELEVQDVQETQVGAEELENKPIPTLSEDNVSTSDIPVELLTSLSNMANYALSKAIQSWSEKVDINIETVRELDEDVFNKIVDEVNLMNNMDLATIKN
jgi:restriction endonuclease Mrr